MSILTSWTLYLAIRLELSLSLDCRNEIRRRWAATDVKSYDCPAVDYRPRLDCCKSSNLRGVLHLYGLMRRLSNCPVSLISNSTVVVGLMPSVLFRPRSDVAVAHFP